MPEDINKRLKKGYDIVKLHPFVETSFHWGGFSCVDRKEGGVVCW